jgi:DNA-binding NarL/FixJ family response regulator
MRDAGTADIRILIVDDHAVVRAGLRLLIDTQQGMTAIGEAGSVDEAIEEARTLEPDLVLLDLTMPGKPGLSAMPELLRQRPDVKVLILSMEDDPRYVREAFAAGARGYLLKEAVANEVVGAIREVAGGGRYVHPELGARLIDTGPSAEAPRTDPLSEREREVLRLLALGHTNHEIAKLLFISVRTAEAHRAHIMKKLNVASRAGLVRYAIANGLHDA